MKNDSECNIKIEQKAPGQNCHTRWRPILANLVVLAMLISTSSVALGGTNSDLFTEDIKPSDRAVSQADARVLEQHMRAGKLDTTILRSRYTTINLNALTENQIGLKLFNDSYTTITKDRTEQRGPNSYTVYGQIEQEEGSEVLLVVQNNKLAGVIRTGDKLYQIRNVQDGFYVIREIDQATLPRGKAIATPKVLKQSDDENLGGRTHDGGGKIKPANKVIDVMVVYTAAAADANIGIDIQGAIADANMAFSNSHVGGWQLRLVHQAQISYGETGDSYADLDRLTFSQGDAEDPSGIMDNVHTLRDTYGADLVVLITDRGSVGVGGLAWQMNSLSFPKTHGFSITRRSNLFAGSHTFTQELIHNMGGTHNPEDANVTPLFPYSHAHRHQDPNNSITKSFGTAAAYDCPGQPCPIRSYISNPSVTYLGVPTGIENERDNARTLRESLPIISKWQPLKVAFTPRIISPTPGSTINTRNKIFHGGTYGVNHWLQIGTTKGGNNLKDQYMGTSGVITVTGLPYTGTIYVRYWSEMPQGWAYLDYTYTMNVPDEPPKLLSPVPGSLLTTTTKTFTGAHASGDLQHYLYVGSSKGAFDVLMKNMGTNHSITVSGLPNSGKIYVRYWTRFLNGWKYQDHVYGMNGFVYEGGGVLKK